MLEEIEAMANIAVKDLGRARRFYEDTLGLKPEGQEGDEVVSFKSGRSTIYVYRSEFAGTNQATAMSWDVGGRLEEIVKELKSRGVTFEHYGELPGLEVQGDIHSGDGIRIAWFKDPDGNILSLVGK